MEIINLQNESQSFKKKKNNDKTRVLNLYTIYLIEHISFETRTLVTESTECWFRNNNNVIYKSNSTVMESIRHRDGNSKIYRLSFYPVIHSAAVQYFLQTQ